MTIKEKVQSLIDAANTATGEADETLTDAVGSLIDAMPSGSISITENGTVDVAQYASAEVNVSSGDFINPLLYIGADKAKSLFSGYKSLPREFVVEFGSDVNSLYCTFFRAGRTGTAMVGSRLTIKAHGAIKNMDRMMSNMEGGTYETVVINFNTSQVTYWTGAFVMCYGLRNIIGVLDFSSATDCGYVFGNGADHYGYGLVNVTIKANTIPLSIEFQNCLHLADSSIISIANGLNESVTGQTLTLHATPKGKCDTILGTVALDSTGTYHVFTADEAGTVTLTDFITTVKGWTLA